MKGKPNQYTVLTVSCTPAELKIFKKLAADEHLTLSAYVRRLLHKQAENGQAAA